MHEKGEVIVVLSLFLLYLFYLEEGYLCVFLYDQCTLFLKFAVCICNKRM
jgi:hypothetical protein